MEKTEIFKSNIAQGKLFGQIGMRNIQDLSQLDKKISIQEINLPEDKTVCKVELKNHSWVAVIKPTGEILKRDDSKVKSIEFILKSGDYKVCTDGEIQSATVEERVTPQDKMESIGSFIMLASDAPDRHVIDGIGEIPADGKSHCTIQIEKVDEAGELLKGAGHNDVLYLRTTGGVIRDKGGKKPIRQIQLRNGKASFRLTSDTQPRLVVVSVFGAEIPKAEIQIEFTPVE